MKRDSPGNITLLGDFSRSFSLVFLDSMDPATIEMDVTLEYDFATNKVNLVVFDRILTIAIIDD